MATPMALMLTTYKVRKFSNYIFLQLELDCASATQNTLTVSDPIEEQMPRYTRILV
jgi:hypothetical protein